MQQKISKKKKPLTIKSQLVRPILQRHPAQLHIVEAGQHRSGAIGALQGAVHAGRQALAVQHDAAIRVGDLPAIVEADVEAAVGAPVAETGDDEDDDEAAHFLDVLSMCAAELCALCGVVRGGGGGSNVWLSSVERRQSVISGLIDRDRRGWRSLLVFGVWNWLWFMRWEIDRESKSGESLRVTFVP